MSENLERIAWRAAEHEYARRGGSWYFGIFFVGLLLSAVALWQHNFFFLVFVVLAAIVMMIFGRERPRVFDFSIDEKGVKIGNDVFVAYSDIESFFVRERKSHLDEIILRRKKLVNPFLRIPVDSETRQKVVAVLEYRGKAAEERDDSFLDSMADLLGF